MSQWAVFQGDALEGFHFMGFDAELRFVDISRARIAYWAGRRAA